MAESGLAGRVVLVTGANHGIGAATARAFAAQGAAVFLQYLRGPAPTGSPLAEPGEAYYAAQRARSADEVVAAVRDDGGRAEAWECDLADPGVISPLFARAEAAFGPVEVLVNNAAHCAGDSFLPETQPLQNRPLEPGSSRSPALSAESHDRHFAVNSRAVALTIAEFARRHVERGAHWGRIVNVSTDGAPGFSGQVSYGASKHALESYSRGAATELGRFGITVNVVSPGPIQTGYITRELEERLLPDIPLGRLGQPEDVADVIVFLASEQARWLTGQVLYAGGGHRMV